MHGPALWFRNPAAVSRWFRPAVEPIHRTVKVRDAIKLIESHGWRLARTRGSHRQFKHSDRRGLVTIAGKPNDDLAPKTLASILKQAGMGAE